MSSHPGRVREDIGIDIPRPRDLSTKRSPKFVAYVDRIWSLIEPEVRKSFDEVNPSGRQ
jgi:NitT/TauT family transport system ATP-binding protein